MKTLIKHKKQQTGLATVEFTIIVPFLLLFIFATAEFGRLLYQYTALNNTIRNANRYLMTNARLATGIVSVSPEVEADIEKLITYGDLTSTTELLPNLSASVITITTSGDFVTLNVSYPWQPIFATSLSTFGFGNDIDLSFPLISTYTMRAL
ncbi:TadE/TadG family type IV pilus assembly protein [Moritella sp. F3]|uniref:TadE/TadG family type IV pilus assembly protein n=1 Tax=Moritella TaxID=58050 RepID=UPI0018E0C8C7|nr:TadE family protein [Moritella sp. F3]GIC79615.1 hypothetical protein FMO001_43420 [Moritella sp. F1]GIC83551.1 hypothetical protein FMO003_38310 [Moritella sp. F3]